MFNLTAWDSTLLAIGAFVAMFSLVRLMLRKRDQLVGELTLQAREEQQRKELAERLLRRRQKRKPS
jgi:hypothetical protein